MEERRHDFQVIAAEGPVEVRCDFERLEQVVVNLLHNAAKYTPPGGHVWLTATTEGHDAVIRVEDDGLGIATDMLPRVFDLFTQVESSRSVAAGGLGIGLAVVKDLVALQGGLVQVRSDGPGKGAEFVVRLPLADASGPDRPGPSKQPGAPNENRVP